MRAAGWSFLGYGLSQAIKLGSNLVLTRLLAPELYGVMAVGLVVISGLSMLSDIGLSNGAIQSRRGDEPHFLNVSWTVQAVQGVAIAVAMLVSALALKLAADAGLIPVHSVYADRLVPPLVAVLSVNALTSSFESTKVWSARRHLSIGLLTKIELGCSVASIAFMLCWALISPSIWVLAGGMIFGSLLKTVTTHLVLPGSPNRFEWDRSTFDEIIAFGKWVFLSSSFTFLLTNGDKLLLGGLLDSKAMGFYSIAFLLISALQMAVVRTVGYVVMPALGEVHRENPERLRDTIYRIRRPLDAICLVSSGALVVLGQSVVHLLYDSRYAPAGWMLSLLALTLVATRLDVFDQCLIATGRIKVLSLLNGVRLVVLFASVLVGYTWLGAPGAVGGVAASSLVNASTVLGLQARLGLLNVRRELLAVPLFGAGLLAGWLATIAFHRFV